MKAQRRKQGVFGRLAAEFGIIVLGVLVALAADRWNQDRADRVLEADYVARVLVDIRADSAGAADYLESFERIELARDSLLRFVDGALALGSPVSTVMRAFQQFNLQAPTTWNELLESGSFGLIRDTRVRETLSRYYEGDRANVELQLARSDRRGRDPFTDALYPMGLFLPCVGAQECAIEGVNLEGQPDNGSLYRAFAPETFRGWPGIRELLVGLGSHHGTQRVFARTVLGYAIGALEELARLSP